MGPRAGFGVRQGRARSPFSAGIDRDGMIDQIGREQGRRLRWLRRVRGMSQSDLAQACGVSYQQIQKYETAASRVSAAMLWRMAVALGTEVQFFYDGLGGAPPPPPSQARTSALSSRG